MAFVGFNHNLYLSISPASPVTSAAEAPKETPAENTEATHAAAEKKNEASAEQPKGEDGMYTIPE